MKTQRLRKIIDIVENIAIETQEELADELKCEGFNVTQATVSRDIRELRLIKVPAGDNKYRYAVPNSKLPSGGHSRTKRILQDSLVSLDFSENLVVVKTTPGAAQTVALVIDNEGWENIIGTVAGDDTVIVVVKPKSAVQEVINRFDGYIK